MRRKWWIYRNLHSRIKRSVIGVTRKVSDKPGIPRGTRVYRGPLFLCQNQADPPVIKGSKKIFDAWLAIRAKDTYGFFWFWERSGRYLFLPCPYCERNGSEKVFRRCSFARTCGSAKEFFHGNQRAKRVLHYCKRSESAGERRGVSRVCTTCQSAAAYGKAKRRYPFSISIFS